MRLRVALTPQLEPCDHARPVVFLILSHFRSVAILQFNMLAINRFPDAM